MEVYIEYVIIDNLVITALICSISYRVLKARISRLRVAIASILGCVAAIFYPFLSFSAIVLALIKLAVYALLSLVLFYKRPYFFKGAIVFLGVTALMGGMLFMTGYIILGDAKSALILPINDLPIGLIVLAPIIIYFAIKRLILGVSRRRTTADFTYKIEFSVFGKTFNVNGFLDSGNMLFDQPSGLPVVVISAGLTAKILNNQQLLMVAKNQIDRICKSAHYATIDTAGKNGKILVIKPQKFRLYLDKDKNILKEVMLGLTFKGLGREFDALLSPSLF